MNVAIQICGACGAAQYPARDLCRTCLADALRPLEGDVHGTVLAQACVHRSLDPVVVANGPVPIGMVFADCGVRVVARLAPGVVTGARVALRAVPGEAGTVEAVAI